MKITGSRENAPPPPPVTRVTIEMSIEEYEDLQALVLAGRNSIRAAYARVREDDNSELVALAKERKALGLSVITRNYEGIADKILATGKGAL